jgi:hypothetical protein
MIGFGGQTRLAGGMFLAFLYSGAFWRSVLHGRRKAEKQRKASREQGLRVASRVSIICYLPNGG